MGAETGQPRPLYKNPWLIAFVVGVASLTLLRPLAMAQRKAPPPLIDPGAWELIDHNGKPFSSADLAGKVFYADFFFTTCPSICVELTKAMQKIDERIRDDDAYRIVSFSVDPEVDTPEKLRAYREKFGITSERWIFLTAKDRASMVKVLVDQFKLHVGDKKPLTDAESQQDALYDISHLARFVVFDQKGRMRATTPTDSHGLTRMLDAGELLEEIGPDEFE